MPLDERSKGRLAGVHPDLAKVILAAAEDAAFIVTEGLRSHDRQRELFLAKKSRTMNSRHLTGHAVDLAVWRDVDADGIVASDELSWRFAEYQLLAATVKAKAADLGVALVWGGDWTSFKDGPHFELDRRAYP